MLFNATLELVRSNFDTLTFVKHLQVGPFQQNIRSRENRTFGVRTKIKAPFFPECCRPHSVPIRSPLSKLSAQNKSWKRPEIEIVISDDLSIEIWQHFVVNNPA